MTIRPMNDIGLLVSLYTDQSFTSNTTIEVVANTRLLFVAIYFVRNICDNL